jgi:hypothetical protein
MRQRLRPHLTFANVASGIALFVSLAGGTAYATHLVVNSSDVVDNSLQSVDLKDNAGVTSADVVDDTATNGGLLSADIRNGEVRTGEVRDGALRSADVLNDSLTGDDVDESSFARVPNARHANNSDALGGLSSTEYQRRVTEACGPVQGISAIDADGAVSCAPRAVRPIAMTPVDGGVISSTNVGELDVWASCRGTHLIFRSATSSAATLNWQFSEGTSPSTTVNAGGTVVSPLATVDFSYGTSGRLEGQWIFSTPQSVTTVTLHAFQGPESCEVRGTAEWAPL